MGDEKEARKIDLEAFEMYQSIKIVGEFEISTTFNDQEL